MYAFTNSRCVSMSGKCLVASRHTAGASNSGCASNSAAPCSFASMASSRLIGHIRFLLFHLPLVELGKQVFHLRVAVLTRVGFVRQPFEKRVCLDLVLEYRAKRPHRG